MIVHTPEQAETLRLATDEDMAFVRSVIEHPDVKPTFGPWPEDIEDFALFVAPGLVYGAEVRTDFSVYVHLAVLPDSRGRAAIDAMRALVFWFFKNTDCPRVAGWTPSDNRAGFMFNRLCGARRRGQAKGRTLFAITRNEWEVANGR